MSVRLHQLALIICFFLTHFGAKATDLDSLREALNNSSSEPIESIRLNLDLAEYFFYSNSDSIHFYLQLANSLAKKTDDVPPQIELKLIQYEAYYHYVTGKYRKAIYLCNRLIQKAIEYKNYDKLSFGYNNLSGNYERLGLSDSMYWSVDTAIFLAEKYGLEKNLGSFYQNKANKLVDDSRYDEGIKYYLKSLDNHEKYNRKELINLVQYSLGLTFSSLQDFKSSHSYFDLAIKGHMNAENWHELIRCYNGKAVAYKSEEKYKEAISFFRKAIEVGETYHLKSELLQVFYNLGNTYRLIGDYQSAEIILTKGLSYSDSIGLAIGQQFYSLGLAELYVETNRPNKALAHISRYEELASIPNLMLSEKKGYYELKSQYFEKVGEFEKSLEFLKKARNTTDTINKKLQDEKILSMEKKYSRAKVESENQLLRKDNQLSKKEIEKRTQMNYGLAISGTVFLGFLIVALLGYRKIKNLNIDLKTQKEELFELAEEVKSKNKELESALEEKDKILYQVSHDFKNQMTSIYGISELLKAETIPAKFQDHVDIIHEASEDGIGIINEILEETKKGWILKNQTIDFEKMIVGIERGFSPLLRSKNLRFHTRVPSGFSFQSNKVFVSRILQNLISNSIKYSDPKGVITISAGKKDSRVVLSVSDKGKGFNEDQKKNVFKHRMIEKEKEVESFGFGLLIVKDLADKIGAQIELESEINEGSVISIIL